jgi:hypothetical protein
MRVNVPRDRIKHVCQYCKNPSGNLFVRELSRLNQLLFPELVSSLEIESDRPMEFLLAW